MSYNLNEIIKVDDSDISEITDIILASNETTLIARLGENFVKIFLSLCIKSQNAKLFTLTSNNTNIAYAIFFKKEKMIVKELQKLKYNVLFTIILRLKFNLIYTLILIYFNKDLKLISGKENIDIENSANLTYLAVKQTHRNKGIGRFFIEDILKKHFKNEFVSVETDNKQTLNFYTKYLNFEIVGSRKRYKNDLYLLLKKNK